MNLYWDQCDTVQLAKKYGTPLYVLSESKIRARCQTIHRDFLKKYFDTKAVYASKAFLTTAMCKLIAQEGLGLDVVSGGELYTAIQAGFPLASVEFNGNNKTLEELEMAIDNQIGRIIVDNYHELDTIERLCKEKGKHIEILFRIVPETDTDTHRYISTGHKTSKFGISMSSNGIFAAVKQASNSSYITFKGLHFHVGSQLHTYYSHLNAIHKALHLIADFHQQDIVVEELNIGGGFGICYTKEDRVKPLSYFVEPLVKAINDFCQEHTLTRPTITIEPGRWIIGEAGITLYTIGAVKTNGSTTYYSVDGGMGDNIRPALYQAQYVADVANRLSEEKTECVTLSGKYCESSDLLIQNIHLPKAYPGDVIAVYSTGAYSYSMASNYNRHPLPSVVLACKGQAFEIVKRQTYWDLLRNDCVPKHLEVI